MIENNDLPKGWTIAKFDDLLDYIQPTKYIVESTEYNDKYKTPVLTAGKSFIKGYTNETEGIFNSLPTIIFDDFTTATQFVNFPFKVKSSAMKILQPTCDLVNIKLSYYFMQIQNIKGDTHKRFWISEYSQLPVPLAPLNEQKRILDKIDELITDLDKGIEYLETAQQQLKVYRQAVLKWAFEGKLTHKNVKENELPDGWKLTVLDDVAEMCLGKMLDKNKNKGDYQYYLGNISVRWGRFDLRDLDKMRFEKDEEERYRLKKGDLVICEGGEPGRCAIWNDADSNMKIQKALHRVRVNKTLSEKFLFHFMYFAAMTGKLKKHFTGTTIKHLTGRALKKVEIPLPTILEQNKIISEIELRLSVCDKIEETIETSLLQAEALRLSIIKKAFEGKLVPQNPSDETAEKLLERIRVLRNSPANLTTEVQGKNWKVKPEKEEKVKIAKKKTQLS